MNTDALNKLKGPNFHILPRIRERKKHYLASNIVLKTLLKLENNNK